MMGDSAMATRGAEATRNPTAHVANRLMIMVLGDRAHTHTHCLSSEASMHHACRKPSCVDRRGRPCARLMRLAAS